MPTTGEFSLYIHIPFCAKKCPYCHFFVLPDRENLKQRFVDAITREWKMHEPSLQGKQLVSIYFGGGTPTRLEPHRLQSLLSLILQSGLSIADDCEITLEANPEDVTLSVMQAYQQMGINRVSLGIQSLEEEQLFLLGRSHGVHRGIEAVKMAFAAGLTNISIDLMYDIPRQSLTGWQRTLSRLQGLPITHLSLYNLTFEPHTSFFKRQDTLRPELPSDEESLALLQEGIAAIESLGLQRYEISAFARPGHTSRHNTGYWLGRPFLGLGPSAFSYWEGRRFRHVAHLNRYAEKLDAGQFPIDFEETLSFSARLGELLAIQLRLVQGVDIQLFQDKHGQLPSQLMNTLKNLIQEGLLTRHENQRYALSSKGMLFYDTVASEIIS